MVARGERVKKVRVLCVRGGEEKGTRNEVYREKWLEWGPINLGFFWGFNIISGLFFVNGENRKLRWNWVRKSF